MGGIDSVRNRAPQSDEATGGEGGASATHTPSPHHWDLPIGGGYVRGDQPAHRDFLFEGGEFEGSFGRMWHPAQNFRNFGIGFRVGGGGGWEKTSPLDTTDTPGAGFGYGFVGIPVELNIWRGLTLAGGLDVGTGPAWATDPECTAATTSTAIDTDNDGLPDSSVSVPIGGCSGDEGIWPDNQQHIDNPTWANFVRPHIGAQFDFTRGFSFRVDLASEHQTLRTGEELNGEPLKGEMARGRVFFEAVFHPGKKGGTPHSFARRAVAEPPAPPAPPAPPPREEALAARWLKPATHGDVLGITAKLATVDMGRLHAAGLPADKTIVAKIAWVPQRETDGTPRTITDRGQKPDGTVLRVASYGGDVPNKWYLVEPMVVLVMVDASQAPNESDIETLKAVVSGTADDPATSPNESRLSIFDPANPVTQGIVTQEDIEKMMLVPQLAKFFYNEDNTNPGEILVDQYIYQNNAPALAADANIGNDGYARVSDLKALITLHDNAATATATATASVEVTRELQRATTGAFNSGQPTAAQLTALATITGSDIDGQLETILGPTLVNQDNLDTIIAAAKKLATTIRDLPAPQQEGLKIEVHGFTDNDTTDSNKVAKNAALALRRAQAVAKVLELYGIPSSMIVANATTAHAGTDIDGTPIDANASRRGVQTASNPALRRVEIHYRQGSAPRSDTLTWQQVVSDSTTRTVASSIIEGDNPFQTVFATETLSMTGAASRETFTIQRNYTPAAARSIASAADASETLEAFKARIVSRYGAEWGQLNLPNLRANVGGLTDQEIQNRITAMMALITGSAIPWNGQQPVITDGQYRAIIGSAPINTPAVAATFGEGQGWTSSTDMFANNLIAMLGNIYTNSSNFTQAHEANQKANLGALIMGLQTRYYTAP